MEVRFIEPTDFVNLNKIGKLRADVWQDEGFLLPNIAQNGIWLDELDDVGKHWAIFEKEEVIASARLTLHNSKEEIPHKEEFSPYDLPTILPYGFMSRLVVRKDFRGRGLARKLDNIRLEKAKECNLKEVLILSVPKRMNAIKKLGFKAFGYSGVPADQMPDLSIHCYVMAYYF